MSDYGPGTYHIGFEEYCRIAAVNSAAVKWGAVSMAHMRCALSGTFAGDDSQDRKLGRAIHCRLLEPERYAKEFLVATTCISQYGDGTKCKAPGNHFDGSRWYCGRHKTADCTKPTDYTSIEEGQCIEAMATRLHTHHCMELFRRKGWSELTVVYLRNGVLCKVRIDRCPEDMDILIDLKKTQRGKATDEACQAAIANNGYHISAAMYVDAVKSVHPLGVAPRFAWCFIEDSEPYGVNVIVADEETLDIGRQEADEIIERYQRCEKLGVFPDYMPDQRKPFVGGLPSWYRLRHARIQQGMNA